jgi:hypothetical protein
MDIFSAFSNLGTLQGSIKGYFICFFLIIPFWFLDIMLFSDIFYKNHQPHIIILIAFCISMCWIWTIICCLVNLSFTDNFYETFKAQNENFILYWAAILSIPVLGLSTFLSSYWNPPFKTLIVIKFIAGIISTLVAKKIIIYQVKKAKRMNQQIVHRSS